MLLCPPQSYPSQGAVTSGLGRGSRASGHWAQRGRGPTREAGFLGLP